MELNKYRINWAAARLQCWQWLPRSDKTHTARSKIHRDYALPAVHWLLPGVPQSSFTKQSSMIPAIIINLLEESVYFLSSL